MNNNNNYNDLSINPISNILGIEDDKCSDKDNNDDDESVEDINNDDFISLNNSLEKLNIEDNRDLNYYIIQNLKNIDLDKLNNDIDNEIEEKKI